MNKEEVAALRAENNDLHEAFTSLANYQKALDDLNFAVDETEILSFSKAALESGLQALDCDIYLKSSHAECGYRNLANADKAIAPEILEMVQWCLDNEQISCLPRELLTHGEKATVLCPLIAKSSDMGVVAIQLPVDEESFSEHSRVMMRLFSLSLATVLENLRMRTALKDSMTRFSMVLESVPHAIVTTDMEGTISMLNTAAEVLFSVMQVEALEEPYSAVFAPHIAEIIRQLIKNQQGREGDLELEVSHKLSKETEITLAIAISPLRDGNKEISGYVFICRDISLSREVAKLRQLDHMKNEFISLVSHELRTPIAAIMTYTESLMMEGMVETDEERTEFYQTIYSESERLTRLVNDILDLTKMESGKLDYQFAETEILAIAKNSVMQSTAMAEKRGLTITMEEPTTEIPLIRADGDRLTQVYLNVLSNAIKFTEEGGITIVHRVINGGEQIEVAISDTGQGIDPANYSRIFNKFEQIEDMKHHSSGTGLGMPICKQIVEEGHGGKFWFESEVGRGTTFFITLDV